MLRSFTSSEARVPVSQTAESSSSNTAKYAFGLAFGLAFGFSVLKADSH
jgi:hypothetical protein